MTDESYFYLYYFIVDEISYRLGPRHDQFYQRFDLFHRMVRFVLGNKNYVGPVERVLCPDRDTEGEKLRVLDMGTGGGLWSVAPPPSTKLNLKRNSFETLTHFSLFFRAVDMADEFPHVEVTGVDLAPLQPR
jgi:hypothetical protein